MAYRDLTKKFNSYRKNFRNENRKDFGGGSDSGGNQKAPLIINDDIEMQHNKMPEITKQLPPDWIDLLNSIDADIDTANKQMKQLKQLHIKKSNKSVFRDTEAKEVDQEIQETTKSITSLLHNAKQKLNKVAIKGNESGDTLGYQEKLVRFNVMKARGRAIQQLSMKFSRQQREYMNEVKARQMRGNQFFSDNSSVLQNLNLEAVSEGFTSEQIKEIEQIEMKNQDRTKEISSIAKNVNELHALFKELGVLVVEQGSLLDRIDYNVEMTLENLSGAQDELNKAEKHQKASSKVVCILVLLVLIIIMGFILILKQIK